MPYTTLVAGTTITSSWANANVRDQVVTPFASAAARTSAVTSPIEGMVTYLTDVDQLQVYNGSSWVKVPTAPVVNADIGTGAVSSANILDGTIVNADISTSANIAWNKLGAPPWVRLARTSSYQVFSGEQDIQWDTEVNDTHGYYTSGSTIVVPAGYGGIHAITATVDMAAGISGSGYIKLNVSGFVYAAYQITGNDKCSVSATVYVADSGTIKVTGYNPTSGSQRGWIEVTRIGWSS